jgi:hypothetical protein
MYGKFRGFFLFFSDRGRSRPARFSVDLANFLLAGRFSIAAAVGVAGGDSSRFLVRSGVRRRKGERFNPAGLLSPHKPYQQRRQGGAVHLFAAFQPGQRRRVQPDLAGRVAKRETVLSAPQSEQLR